MEINSAICTHPSEREILSSKFLCDPIDYFVFMVEGSLQKRKSLHETYLINGPHPAGRGLGNVVFHWMPHSNL